MNEFDPTLNHQQTLASNDTAAEELLVEAQEQELENDSLYEMRELATRNNLEIDFASGRPYFFEIAPDGSRKGEVDVQRKVDKKDWGEFAKVFAEGSESLEKLLLKLWDSGIQTKGCCSGITTEHEQIERRDENDLSGTYAYIGFIADKDQANRVVSLMPEKDREVLGLSYIESQERLNFRYPPYNAVPQDFRGLTGQQSNEFFDYINKLVENVSRE